MVCLIVECNSSTQGRHSYTQFPHFTGCLHLIMQALLLWLPVRSVKGVGGGLGKYSSFLNYFMPCPVMQIGKLAGRHQWWSFFMGYSFKKISPRNTAGSHGLKVWTQPSTIRFIWLKEPRNTFFFPLLVDCFSNFPEDGVLLTMFHLQMKTGKTGHPSVPRRMAGILQVLPTGCSALWDSCLKSISSLWLWSLPCPLFTAVRKTTSCFPCQTFTRAGRGGGEEQGRSLLVLYCVVCVGC